MFNLIALVLLCSFICWGVWFFGDGWWSLLQYKGTKETFWRNNIFRWIRLFGGVFITWASIYLVVWLAL